MRYTFELSEEQAEIIKIALEEYFRLRMNQTWDFAVAGYEVNAEKLRDLFDPDKFVIKLTPMHKTRTALDNGIKTDGDYTTMYPYQHIEEDLKKVGFDVLVFIASEYEDLGRITCGNAILSGTLPDCPYEEE